MKKLLLLVALSATVASAFAQKPFPKGAGIVTGVRDVNLATETWIQSSPGNQVIYHNIWQDPNIKFIVVRDHWYYAELNGPGQFDWTYLEQGLSLAKQYNKPIVICVNGSVYPPWLPKAPYNVPIWTNSNGDSCPDPWDSNLQAQWAAFVSQLGSRYDSEPLVCGVMMWAGGTAIECFFAVSDADDDFLDAIARNHGYKDKDYEFPGASFWEDNAKVLIQDYISAFPTTSCYLSTGDNYVGDQHASMTSLACWFEGLNPNVNGLESNALSSGYPAAPSATPPSGPPFTFIDCSGNKSTANSQIYQFPHTTLPINTVTMPVIMYQYLDPIRSPEMQPGPTPVTNTQVVTNGFNAGAKAIQCYPNDPSNDNEAGVDWFNAQFGL
jgi:hypothetical protein